MIYHAALVDARSRIRQYLAQLVAARNANIADLEMLTSGLEGLDSLIGRENGIVRLPPRPMTGFIATLSTEQLADALAYDGDDHLGRAHYAHSGGGER